MLSFENSESFAQDEISLVTLKNFSEPEDGFVWSNGSWCEVLFAFQISPGHSTAKSADLILDIDAFRGSDEDTGQNVCVYLNGLRIGTACVPRRAIHVFTFDPKILRATNNILTLDTPDADSPKNFGGDDYRVLGVQIHSLQIRKNTLGDF